MIRPLSAAVALVATASFLNVPSSLAASRTIAGGRCTRVGASSTTASGVALKSSSAKRWAARTLPAVAVRGGSANSVAAPTANSVSGCVTKYNAKSDYFPDKATVLDATNFAVRYERNYKVITVPHVFAGSNPTSYVLVQCGTPTPKLVGDLAGATVVNVPVTRAVIMSTTIAPSFEIVGATDKIVAVDDPANYSTPAVVAGLAGGTIKGVGNNAKADVEAIVALKPGAVITYTAGGDDGLDKFRQAGLHVVLDASSLESTPLGRAEWTKLVGLLTNREKAAQTAFDKLRADYTALAAKATAAPTKPVVISGSMYQGTWYMPGGKSFPAQLIRDAGGRYPWSDDSTVGSLSLDLEAVLAKAGDATVWINAGYQWDTLKAALAEDARYKDLNAYKADGVWGNDKRVNATGGSDFFETAVARPDLVLADLVAVLHPDLQPGYTTTWYRHIGK